MSQHRKTLILHRGFSVSSQADSSPVDWTFPTLMLSHRFFTSEAGDTMKNVLFVHLEVGRRAQCRHLVQRQRTRPECLKNVAHCFVYNAF